MSNSSESPPTTSLTSDRLFVTTSINPDDRSASICSLSVNADAPAIELAQAETESSRHQGRVCADSLTLGRHSVGLANTSITACAAGLVRRRIHLQLHDERPHPAVRSRFSCSVGYSVSDQMSTHQRDSDSDCSSGRSQEQSACCHLSGSHTETMIGQATRGRFGLRSIPQRYNRS